MISQECEIKSNENSNSKESQGNDIKNNGKYPPCYGRGKATLEKHYQTLLV